MTGIYAIRFDNGKMYIGLSKNIAHRMACHISNDRLEKYPTIPLYQAMKRHYYVWGVIEECDEDSLGEREKYWIEYYNTMLNENGYNYRDGGAINIGYTGKRKRRVLSEEHKRRISESCKGREISEEQSKSISDTLSNGSHHNISQWIIEYNNGDIIEVTNLKKWCRETGYNCGCLQRMNTIDRGTHKDIISCKKAKDR